MTLERLNGLFQLQKNTESSSDEADEPLKISDGPPAPKKVAILKSDSRMSGSPTKVIVSNERKDSERKTPSRDVVSPSGNIKIEAIAPIKASIKNEQIKLKAEFTKDSPLTNQLVYNGKLKILQLKSRSSISPLISTRKSDNFNIEF